MSTDERAAKDTFDHLVNVRLGGVRDSEVYFSQQVSDQNPVLFFNTQMWMREAFELALLYWGQRNWTQARHWFAECLRVHALRTEQFQLLRDLSDTRAAFTQDGQSPRFARIAGYLTDTPVSAPMDEDAQDERSGTGGWFDRVFLDACTAGKSIDQAASEASKQLAVANRVVGSVALAEWDFYRDLLEGRWAPRTSEEMLATHGKLFRQRAKRRGLGNVLHGDGKYNELVPDFMFAMILKKIGWSGDYRHAWP